jgi:CheY-like chemotaxis protein
MTAVQALPTILLVDDDFTARFLLRRLVERFWPRVRILEAENGLQALAVVQAHCEVTQVPKSLLVLLDLRMPVLDGFEFLERFQLLPNHCKQAAAVVVSSTSTNPGDLARVDPLADAWRPKPLRTDELEQLLHEYLPAALEV